MLQLPTHSCIASIFSDIIVSSQNALGDMVGTCIVDHVLRAEVGAQDDGMMADHYSSYSGASRNSPSGSTNG